MEMGTVETSRTDEKINRLETLLFHVLSIRGMAEGDELRLNFWGCDPVEVKRGKATYFVDKASAGNAYGACRAYLHKIAEEV